IWPSISEVARKCPTMFRNKEKAATPLAGMSASPGIRPAIRAVPRKKFDRSDIIVGALGITLALICALFPWYIFFNQEQFGVTRMVFEGSRGNVPPGQLNYQPALVGQP